MADYITIKLQKEVNINDVSDSLTELKTDITDYTIDTNCIRFTIATMHRDRILKYLSKALSPYHGTRILIDVGMFCGDLIHEVTI